MTLSTCPERLLVSLQMLTTNSVSYLQRKLDSDDLTTLQLHHQSLTISPETKINHSIVKILVTRIDISIARECHSPESWQVWLIRLNEATEDSLSIYLTYAALALSVLNSIALVIACKCIFRVILQRMSQASLATTASQPTVTLQERSSNIEPPQAPRYTRPIRKQHVFQAELQATFDFFFSVCSLQSSSIFTRRAVPILILLCQYIS